MASRYEVREDDSVSRGKIAVQVWDLQRDKLIGRGHRPLVWAYTADQTKHVFAELSSARGEETWWSEFLWNIQWERPTVRLSTTNSWEHFLAAARKPVLK